MTDTAAPLTPSPSAPPVPAWRKAAFIICGLIFIALGVGAIFAPLTATLAASLSFGALMLTSGVIGLVMLVADWRAKAFIWRLIWSIVAIVGGLCLLLHPWPGAFALTLILGVALMAQGLVAFGHALAHRTSKTCPWGRMAIAGVIGAIWGALLIWMLPHAGMIVPGVFLAFNLISYGFSLIAVAPDLRRTS